MMMMNIVFLLSFCLCCSVCRREVNTCCYSITMMTMLHWCVSEQLTDLSAYNARAILSSSSSYEQKSDLAAVVADQSRSAGDAMQTDTEATALQFNDSTALDRPRRLPGRINDVTCWWRHPRLGFARWRCQCAFAGRRPRGTATTAPQYGASSGRAAVCRPTAGEL